MNISRRNFLKWTGITTILGVSSLLPNGRFVAEGKQDNALQFQYEENGRKISHDFIFGTELYPQPEFQKPMKGVPYFDPVFGTKITRISDRTTDKLAPVIEGSMSIETSKNGSCVHPTYPKHNYDNADGTYLLFQGSLGSGQLLYDSKTLRLVKSLDTKAVSWGQTIDARWDAHNPDIFYYEYKPATAISKYNVRNDKFEVVHDFSKEFPGARRITMAEEGDCSYDSRFFAFMLIAPRGDEQWACVAVFCYDRVENKITGKIDIPNPRFEDPGGGNWVGMSPSGKYVLLGTAPMLVCDREFRKRPVKLTHGGGWHCDVGLDDEGREVILYNGGKTFSPGGQSDGCYAMCDLETGTETVLTNKIVGSVGIHFDCSCIFTPGWGLVSTYHAAPQKQTHWSEYSIHLIELTRRKTPPPRIWRICHTHVNREFMLDDPFATFNRFGTKIFFGSNWGIPLHHGGDIDAYQVELPADWYETLMGREKAARLRKIAEEMVRKKW